MRIISVWHITTVTTKVMLLLPGLVPGRERSFEMDIKKFQEGLLALKNKKQQKGKYNKHILTILLVVILGHALFFTSNVWFGNKGELLPATKINSVKSWNDRKVQLLSWKYSEKQRMMELQFTIDNQSYDGVNTYKFKALDRNKGYLKTDTVIEQDDLFVVRINEVPTSWTQIAFWITMPDNTNDTCKFITNEKAVDAVSKIEDKDYNGYMIERIDNQIAFYQGKIDALNDDINGQNVLIENCKKDIESYQDRLTYQTDQEQQETNKLINDAQNTIKTANGDIDTDNASIEEYNERITLLEEQKAQYKEN